MVKSKILHEMESHTLINATIRGESPDAVNIDGYDGSSIWLPKSQIEMSESDDGVGTEILIPNWLIEKESIV